MYVFTRIEHATSYFSKFDSCLRNTILLSNFQPKMNVSKQKLPFSESFRENEGEVDTVGEFQLGDLFERDLALKKTT